MGSVPWFGFYGLDNNPSDNTATKVTGGLFKIFLSLVMGNYAGGPDLVVTQVLASSNAITANPASTMAWNLG